MDGVKVKNDTKQKIKSVVKAQKQQEEKDKHDIAVNKYILEMAKIKYDSELRREDSIIQQAGHMQAVFSFVSIGVVTLIPVIISYKGSLSLNYLIFVFSTILIVLFFSLFAATMAQNRKGQDLFPDVEKQISYIHEHEEYFDSEINRLDYLSRSYSEMQASLTKNNRKRVLWIKISMNSFYASLVLCVFWFIISICKII